LNVINITGSREHHDNSQKQEGEKVTAAAESTNKHFMKTSIFLSLSLVIVIDHILPRNWFLVKFRDDGMPPFLLRSFYILN
jgi:flagellar biogenesis protein FliO